MFFKLIWTADFLCVQYAAFKATSSIFNTFWHHLLFFSHLPICLELNDPEIEKHYKWTLKRLKLGMVSSFHPHGMCKRVDGYGNNWTHFLYKLDNLFRSIRVSDENSSVTRALQCFLNLFELQPIFGFSMQHSKRRHQFPTRSDIICCFSVIYRFV